MTTDVTARQRIAQGREAEIFAWGDGRVLRLFRTPRARSVLEREAGAMRAARAVMPAVPEVFDIVEHDGRQGIVMERVDGPDYITLLGRKPWLVWSAGRTLGRVHAALHAAQAPAGLEPLKARIDRLLSLPGVPPDGAGFVRALMGTLPDGDRLCHGDFHPGNVILAGRGPVVIDWPNATAGEPAADFARTDLLLQMGDPPPGTPSMVRYMQGVGRKVIRAAYRRAYVAARPTDDEFARRWQVVRMADRLIGDGIEAERETLLRMLRAAGAPV